MKKVLLATLLASGLLVSALSAATVEKIGVIKEVEIRANGVIGIILDRSASSLPDYVKKVEAGLTHEKMILATMLTAKADGSTVVLLVDTNTLNVVGIKNR